MRLCILVFLLTLVVEAAAQTQNPGQLRVPKDWTSQFPEAKVKQIPGSIPQPGSPSTDPQLKVLEAHAEVIRRLSQRIDELEKRLGELELRVGRK